MRGRSGRVLHGSAYYDLHFARFVPVAGDFDVRADPLAQAFDVADHADLARAGDGVEALQRLHGGIEMFPAQGAESFVDEKHVHAQPRVVQAGEPERESERDEELLAAGERVDRTRRPAVEAVENRKRQIRAGKRVAVRQLPEVVVGLDEDVPQHVRLDFAPDLVPLFIAEVLVDGMPFVPLGAESVRLLLLRGALGRALVIVLDLLLAPPALV